MKRGSLASLKRHKYKTSANRLAMSTGVRLLIEMKFMAGWGEKRVGGKSEGLGVDSANSY